MYRQLVKLQRRVLIHPEHIDKAGRKKIRSRGGVKEKFSLRTENKKRLLLGEESWNDTNASLSLFFFFF